MSKYLIFLALFVTGCFHDVDYHIEVMKDQPKDLIKTAIEFHKMYGLHRKGIGYRIWATNTPCPWDDEARGFKKGDPSVFYTSQTYPFKEYCLHGLTVYGGRSWFAWKGGIAAPGSEFFHELAHTARWEIEGDPDGAHAFKDWQDQADEVRDSFREIEGDLDL